MPCPTSSPSGTSPPAARAVRVLVDHRSALVTAGTVQMLSGAADLAVCTGRSSPRDRHGADPVEADVLVTDPERGLAAAALQRERHRIVVLAGDDAPRPMATGAGPGVRAWLGWTVQQGELLDTIRRVAADACLAAGACAAAPPPRGGRIDATRPPRRLTARETMVLDLLAQGQCDKRIAATLDLALPTVKTHVRSILNKLQVGSRTAAAVAAVTGSAYGVAPASPA